MKTLILTLSLAALAGCASPARYSANERCANRDMVLDGITATNTTASNYYVGETHAYAESVSCAVPKSEKDRCEVDLYKRTATPKNEYNSSYDSKYFLSGLGYWVAIVPGVVLKVVYDGQLSDAEKKSAAVYSEHAQSCQGGAPRVLSSKSDAATNQ
jgi:hypothetical protein